MEKAKVKALLGTGLAALCSHIKQCNTVVSELANATADSIDEVDDILHESRTSWRQCLLRSRSMAGARMIPPPAIFTVISHCWPVGYRYCGRYSIAGVL